MDNLPMPAPPFDIPAATVQRWVNMESTAPLEVPLTRADIDNLFFAIDSNTRATQSLQKALVDYTNGKLEDANAANNEASAKLAESSNRLRVFLNAVMASAKIIP